MIHLLEFLGFLATQALNCDSSLHNTEFHYCLVHCQRQVEFAESLKVDGTTVSKRLNKFGTI